MSDQNPYKAPVSTEEAAPTGPVTAKTRQLLGEASPWLRFLVVLGYIFLIAGALGVVGAAVYGFVSGGALLASLLGGAFVLLVTLVISYFPLRILNRLANGAKHYKTNGDAAGLELVASGVRGLAKFYGIFTIVILSLYAVAGVFVGITFLAFRSTVQ